MRAFPLALALIGLAAGAARAQPSPQPGPPSQVLQQNLFGEREPEPGDEEAASGAVEPPPAAAAPVPSSEAYDARVRQSFAAAESFSGPLDGGWTLSAKDEGRLYDVRFVDRAGKLEAVWRDLRRPGALGASGVVDAVERAGGHLTLRFSPQAGVEDVATLVAASGGVWTGELAENGRKRAVSLARTSP